jgi:prephenate dehydratase
LNLYKQAVNELIEIVEKKDLIKFEKYFNRNKKYFKTYAKDAYEESSYLIDKLMEKQRSPKPIVKIGPKKSDIAVLGPKNTFSDLASDEYIIKNKFKGGKFFVKDIDEACELVEKGEVKLGIVPIENKLNGTVRETIDSLFKRNVKIVEELKIPIHHSLLALAHAKKSDIKTIISHSQALKQCKIFIKKTFPKANLENINSTVAAIEFVINKNEKSIAAIGPKTAGEKNSLKVIKEGIEDQKDNETTFVIIKKNSRTNRDKEQKNSTKISIAFHFSADAPGSLFTVFKDFADAKINMTKIESRPTKKSFGDYIFYLDFEGKLNDSKTQIILKKIEKKVARLKILGSY